MAARKVLGSLFCAVCSSPKKTRCTKIGPEEAFLRLRELGDIEDDKILWHRYKQLRSPISNKQADGISRRPKSDRYDDDTADTLLDVGDELLAEAKIVFSKHSHLLTASNKKILASHYEWIGIHAYNMASELQPITVEKAREFHRCVEHLLNVLNYMTRKISEASPVNLHRTSISHTTLECAEKRDRALRFKPLALNSFLFQNRLEMGEEQEILWDDQLLFNGRVSATRIKPVLVMEKCVRDQNPDRGMKTPSTTTTKRMGDVVNQMLSAGLPLSIIRVEAALQGSTTLAQFIRNVLDVDTCANGSTNNFWHHPMLVWSSKSGSSYSKKASPMGPSLFVHTLEPEPKRGTY